MKAKMQSRNSEKVAEEVVMLKHHSQGQQNTVEQASDRGASKWLTTIPMTKYGF